MPIPLTSPAPCNHAGTCRPAISAAECGMTQLAQSLKYSVNHTWQFAEITPGVFALYNPIRREVVSIGTLEDIMAVYRAREPFIPIRREELPLSRPRASRFQNVVVNI